jgi:hypothetical protein
MASAAREAAQPKEIFTFTLGFPQRCTRRPRRQHPVIAAHASVIMANHTTNQNPLWLAIDSRFRLTAFCRYSTHHNVKVIRLAEELTTSRKSRPGSDRTHLSDVLVEDRRSCLVTSAPHPRTMTGGTDAGALEAV